MYKPGILTDEVIWYKSYYFAQLSHTTVLFFRIYFSELTKTAHKQKVFEEYIRLFMPDAITPDAKTIEREIAAIKDQANCLQLYTVSNAAALSILPSIKNQIDDVKAKINEYNIKEDAKTKNDNADSIINNKNKEAKINANADWTENKLRKNYLI